MIPLIVLAGSLGAGKTTVLRELVENQSDARCHLIVNEIGEVPPSLGDFMVRSESAVVLRGGCACCIRREDLVEDLIAFANDRARQDKDLLFLELSGIADPAPVIHTIFGHPFLANHYDVQEVITVVDAYDAGVARRDGLWARQIALADRCILAKADLVSIEVLDELSDTIADINPWATLVPSDHGHLGVVRERPASDAARPVVDPTNLNAQPEHGTLPSVTSVMVGDSFDWGSFGVWLSLLLHRWGHDVLRVKGLVPASAGEYVTIQAVHHVVFPPEHVALEEHGEGHIVLITKHIDTDLLRRSLDAFVQVK
jgi:G3E family GTPase